MLTIPNDDAEAPNICDACVKRIAFASFNHAFGMHSVDDTLALGAPIRPDGWYGLSEAWGELMGRMYWNKHGIEGIALRIGSCEAEPANFRHLSTWLSHDDTVELSRAASRRPPLASWRCGASRTTSAPTGSHAPTSLLGYRPQSRSEDHADRLLAQANPLDPIAQRFQGGAFMTLDDTPPAQRPQPTHRR